MPIKMEQPSLVIHSHDVPPPYYMMWRTITVEKGTTAAMAASLISHFNRQALAQHRTPLRNVILNAHGSMGRVAIGGAGGPGIEMATVGVFGILKPLNIGTIWLTSCGAAIGPPGKAFCQMLANVAGCSVVSSDESQEGTFTQLLKLGLAAPMTSIDDMEGNIFLFQPVGGHKLIDPNRDVWTVKSHTQKVPLRRLRRPFR